MKVAPVLRTRHGVERAVGLGARAEGDPVEGEEKATPEDEDHRPRARAPAVRSPALVAGHVVVGLRVRVEVVRGHAGVVHELDDLEERVEDDGGAADGVRSVLADDELEHAAILVLGGAVAAHGHDAARAAHREDHEEREEGDVDEAHLERSPADSLTGVRAQQVAEHVPKLAHAVDGVVTASTTA